VAEVSQIAQGGETSRLKLSQAALAGEETAKIGVTQGYVTAQVALALAQGA